MESKKRDLRQLTVWNQRLQLPSAWWTRASGRMIGTWTEEERKQKWAEVLFLYWLKEFWNAAGSISWERPEAPIFVGNKAAAVARYAGRNEAKEHQWMISSESVALRAFVVVWGDGRRGEIVATGLDEDIQRIKGRASWVTMTQLMAEATEQGHESSFDWDCPECGSIDTMKREERLWCFTCGHGLRDEPEKWEPVKHETAIPPDEILKTDDDAELARQQGLTGTEQKNSENQTE